jgi:PAS domain S-box-containing protein
METMQQGSPDDYTFLLNEQKRLADELIDAKEMTEGIIETLRESLLVLDGRMRVMLANRFFYETFQVSPEETVGKSLYDLGNGQWNIPRLRELLEQVLPEKNPFQDFEVVHDFPHIGERTMLLNARQILLRGEPRERILLAIEDITERKELQERKDDFISMAAHELKTPLTSIKAYAQITEKALKDERYWDAVTYTTRMSAQIERLNLLIFDLLDVSRIEAGKLAFTLTAFDFDTFVKETVTDLKPSFPSHELQIEGQTHAAVCADRERTAQAITNLITNAVKYSPKAERILARLERVGQEVRLHVTDYGVGIEEQHRERIFERFYRVNDATDKKYPGLGIGLYIASQIIEREGGRIWLTSTPGKGSTFSFSLPIVSGE